LHKTEINLVIILLQRDTECTYYKEKIKFKCHSVHKFNIQPNSPSPLKSRCIAHCCCHSGLYSKFGHNVVQHIFLGEEPKTTKVSFCLHECDSLKMFVMVIICSMANPELKK